jgi:NAD(P)-dependent dehydrogenase (short-subunit alcohol dehydrogenase family)
MRSQPRPVALVTGAGRGIGRAAAEALASAGYAVVVAERAAPLGRRVERALQATGAPAVFVHTDVAARGAAEHAVRVAVGRFGRLDCVVNNAGVLTVAPLHRLSRRDLQEMVAVNLLGPLLVARAALPILRRRRRGAIINVASLLGKYGLTHYVTYCATKFGMVGLTQALADELHGTGISVWAVCPGQVDTAMARRAGASEREGLIRPASVARVIASLATGRRRTPSGAAIDILH